MATSDPSNSETSDPANLPTPNDHHQLPVIMFRPVRLRTWVIISILLNVLLVVFGRGSALQILIIYSLIFCCAVPALLIAIVTKLTATGIYVDRGKSAVREHFKFACVLGSLVLSYPPGILLLRDDIASAKQYCEELIPRIEDYRRHHGEYPQSVLLLGELPHPPCLLRKLDYYRSDGNTYGFSFSNPAGMMDGYSWNNTERTWHSWD